MSPNIKGFKRWILVAMTQVVLMVDLSLAVMAVLIKHKVGIISDHLFAVPRE